MRKNSNNMVMARKKMLWARTSMATSTPILTTRTMMGTEGHPPRLLGSSVYRSKPPPMDQEAIAMLEALEVEEQGIWPCWAMSAALTTTV